MKNPLLFLALAFCATGAFAQSNNSAQADNSKPFVLGSIEQIQSVELSEKRTLNIYLPADYKANDTTRYPVIYLLDGSADEDFIPVVGQVYFNSYPWINRLPESIVVGIANVNRQSDFTFPSTLDDDKKLIPASGGSAKFIAFIQKELQPYIEKKYKTNSSKALIGESLGGLLATEVLLKQPSLFNKYVIISPSLFWDNGSLLKLPSDILLDTYTRKTDIYIGVGKEGLAPSKIPHVMEVDANLLLEKLQNSKSKSVHVTYDYLPTEDHATIASQALYDAIKMGVLK